MRQRMSPKERKAQILAAALDVAEAKGYQDIQRKDVAERAGCSEALVGTYFSTLTELKRSIVRAAIAQERLRIVAQAIANRSPYVKKISPELHELATSAIGRT